MQFEHFARLFHGQRLQRRHAVVEEVALGRDDHARDADDGALAQVERAHQLTGLLELVAQIRLVRRRQVRGFQQLQIPFGQKEPRHAVAAGRHLVFSVGSAHNRHLGHYEIGVFRRQRRPRIGIQPPQPCKAPVQFLQ